MAVDLGHQHVTRLQIAVDDPFLMSMLHRVTDGGEELEPGPHREAFLIAIVSDRHAGDQFHHEERLTGVGRATVVDAGAVGMVHQRQCLSLGVEPGNDGSRIHADLDQLERHVAEDGLGLVGEVDRSHAPSPRILSSV